jgi:hypothetical protein
MEIFESVTNILSLLFGGSLISIVTWKFARRKADAEAKKAEAEAKSAEAEAKSAEAEAQQEKQNYYQQIIDDIAKDRDYYKRDRDEQRTRMDEMDVKFRELQRDVARNGRMVEAMRPFMCADLKCPHRQRVTISPEGEVEKGKLKVEN